MDQQTEICSLGEKNTTVITVIIITIFGLMRVEVYLLFDLDKLLDSR